MGGFAGAFGAGDSLLTLGRTHTCRRVGRYVLEPSDFYIDLGGVVAKKSNVLVSGFLLLRGFFPLLIILSVFPVSALGCFKRTVR